MKKVMQKEVTQTTIKMARIEVLEGETKLVELPEVVQLGNVSKEKAQKWATKEHGAGTTVTHVEPNALRYEMEVLEFIKLATLVEPKSDEETQQET